MALHLASAPKRTTRVLRDSIEDVAPLLGLAEGKGEQRLRRSRPIPVYTFAAADLVAPYRRLSELRAGPDGWRFLLRQGKRSWLADLRAAEGSVTLNQVLGGSAAKRFADAYRFARKAVEGDSELRLVKLASARMEALWLMGETDLFVDLDSEEPILCGPELLAGVVRRRV